MIRLLTFIFFALLLSASPVFSASKVFQNTTDVEDNWTNSADGDNNSGGAATMWLLDAGRTVLIRLLHLSDTLGAGVTIDTCLLEMNFTTVTASGSLYVYQELHPWAEGRLDQANLGANDTGSTHTRWYRIGAAILLEWGTNGSLCADAQGFFNRGDNFTCGTNDTADYIPTVLDSASVSGTGAITVRIPVSLVQDWYDGDIDDSSGLVIFAANSLNAQFNSSENGTNPVKFTVYYTTGEAALPPRRRRILLEGG